MIVSFGSNSQRHSRPARAVWKKIAPLRIPAGPKFGRNRATDATGIILALRCRPGFDADQLVADLWAHRNLVVHSGDPGRQPGGAFGLFAFRPGSHAAFEDDLAAVGLDRDAARINQRAAPESFLD